jgi:DNA-binding XRE family transcriptional regulator
MRQLLTVTWDLSDELSVERAIGLAERWAAGQLVSRTLPAPVRVVTKPIADGAPVGVATATFADRRKALGLTQRDVARLAGVTATVVGRVERSLIGPRHHAAIAITRVLAAAEASR